MAADDKSQYLPLAQVMRMFANMPDGYNKFQQAYPGILDSNADANTHVVQDPASGAFMVAPPQAVADTIRAKALAAQSQQQVNQAQQNCMVPINSAAPVQPLTREQMIAQAVNQRNNNGQ